MYKTILLMAVVISLALTACSRESGKAGSNSKDKSGVHSPSVAQPKTLADVLKGKTLAGYESQTIGQAFDGYRNFSSTEWKETRAEKGKIYVDFVGWLDSNTVERFSGKGGVAVKGLNVKFAIYDNGSYGVVMISRFGPAANGAMAVYPQQNIAEILASIYGNRQLPL